MLFLSTLPILPVPVEMFFDASLLTLIVFPLLYVLVFRPMRLHIEERFHAEEGLREAKDKLEIRVKERTEELNRSNKELKQEVSERQQAERGAIEAKIQLEHLLESTPVVIYSCRIEGDKFIPTFASTHLNNFLGYNIKDYFGQANWWSENIHEEDRERVFAGFPSRLFTDGMFIHEYRFKAMDGTYRWIHDQITLIRDKDGRPEKIVGSWLDITERKEYEDRIQKWAYYDNLTSLPNRRMFFDRFKQIIPRMKRQKLLAAILFLDLNDFKIVNDTLGHDPGDLLLQEIANRFTQCVRTSDTVARIGGDEFAILLPEIAKVEDIAKLIKRIFTALEVPIEIKGHNLSVTISVGISLFPADGEDAETLLKKADLAMYRVKGKKENSFQFYTAM